MGGVTAFFEDIPRFTIVLYCIAWRGVCGGWVLHAAISLAVCLKVRHNERIRISMTCLLDPGAWSSKLHNILDLCSTDFHLLYLSSRPRDRNPRRIARGRPTDMASSPCPFLLSSDFDLTVVSTLDQIFRLWPGLNIAMMSLLLDHVHESLVLLSS